MTYQISPWVREQYPAGFFDQLFALEEGLGAEIVNRILMEKGGHISIIGNSRSGKTEKKKWMQLQLVRIGETLIEFDTGKPGDIECYFDNPNPAARFNKPVTVLIPMEGPCKFEVTGVPENIPVTIIRVPAPEMYWDLIRPGEINIISLRNYFQDTKALKRYMRRMLAGFALRARLGHFHKWTPAILSIDEAHEAAGSQSVDRQQESILLTMDLSNMERQLASSKIRMMLTTQSLYDLPEAVRKNTHIFIVNRGAWAEKRDNKDLHYLQGFADRAYPWQGWMVIHGRRFYSQMPIPFQLVGIPENIRINYMPEGDCFADSPLDEEKDEVISDFRADPKCDRMMQMWMKAGPVESEPVDVITSRYDVPAGIDEL